MADGEGGLTVQLGKNNPKDSPEVILEGIRIHEKRHIKDLQKINPTPGKGAPKGTIPTFQNIRKLWQSEVDASEDEIAYLRGQLKNPKYPKATIELINIRIKQMEDYRDGFLEQLRNKPNEPGD